MFCRIVIDIVTRAISKKLVAVWNEKWHTITQPSYFLKLFWMLPCTPSLSARLPNNKIENFHSFYTNKNQLTQPAFYEPFSNVMSFRKTFITASLPILWYDCADTTVMFEKRSIPYYCSCYGLNECSSVAIMFGIIRWNRSHGVAFYLTILPAQPRLCVGTRSH